MLPMAVESTTTPIVLEIFKEFDGENLSKPIFRSETKFLADKLIPGQLGNFTAHQMGEIYGFDFHT